MRVLILIALIFVGGCDGKRGHDGLTGPSGFDGRSGTDGCDFAEIKNYKTGECIVDPRYSPFNPDDLCLWPKVWNYEKEGGCVDAPAD